MGMLTNLHHIIQFKKSSFCLNLVALCILSSILSTVNERQQRKDHSALKTVCIYTSAGAIQAVKQLSVGDLQLQARIHTQASVNRAQDVSITVMLHV